MYILHSVQLHGTVFRSEQCFCLDEKISKKYNVSQHVLPEDMALNDRVLKVLSCGTGESEATALWSVALVNKIF